jgi:hypothetical protein
MPDGRTKMKSDAIILLRLLTTTEGGRRTSIQAEGYSCPIMINEQEGFDCRFVMSEPRLLELGNEYEIPVKFLDRSAALASLAEGTEVSLWEGKKIASGVVKKILVDSEG